MCRNGSANEHYFQQNYWNIFSSVILRIIRMRHCFQLAFAKLWTPSLILLFISCMLYRATYIILLKYIQGDFNVNHHIDHMASNQTNSQFWSNIIQRSVPKIFTPHWFYKSTLLILIKFITGMAVELQHLPPTSLMSRFRHQIFVKSCL